MAMNKEPIRATVLVLDDDEAVREAIEQTLSRHYAVHCAPDVAAAERLLREYDIDVLVCDDQMPGETGLMFMARIKDRYPALKRILISGHLDKEMLTYATNNAEILRVVEKPFQSEELLRSVGQSLARVPDVAPAREPGDPALPVVMRWTAYGVLCTASIAVVAAVSGSVVVLFLYALKSYLGIDIFSDIHFHDLFGR